MKEMGIVDTAEISHKPRVWQVFVAFLMLGCTSFGGPTAHLGYFRTEFVARRGWLDDDNFAELMTLSQFLPGPSSSQVGFGIGLHRAGVWGALAAFVGFTLPSATLLILIALGTALIQGPMSDGILTGLKVVAVAIVAQAVLGMARTNIADVRRASIAVFATASALLVSGTAGQLLALGGGAIAGLVWCRGNNHFSQNALRLTIGRAVGVACLLAFIVLLLGGPVVLKITGSELVAQFDAYYRAGSLVFGGGHVVLPLLEAGVVDAGAVDPDQFLAGYGAAQAVPGPLFTFVAYLGTLSQLGHSGVFGGTIALIAIFLPGFLLFLGVLPFWNVVRNRVWARAMVAGMTAAVVGILGAALYNPVFTTAITSPGWLAVALACFVLLTKWRVAPWIVVAVGATCGMLTSLMP